MKRSLGASVTDTIIACFAMLQSIPYIAPWSDEALPESVRLTMTRQSIETWVRVMGDASSDDVRQAFDAWIAADVTGHWPKPGQVRAFLPVRRAEASLLDDDGETVPLEVRSAVEAGMYPEVRGAIWDGPKPFDRWLSVDETSPETEAAVERLIASGWARSRTEGVIWLRQDATSARLLFLRSALVALARRNPVPESSYDAILFEAANTPSVMDPSATREVVRDWMVARIAVDAERRTEHERRRTEHERRLREPPAKVRSPVPPEILARVGTGVGR